ncbi:MAG: hypothetical protein RSF92_12280 [Niameybacter sp.]|uniref:hypothetical protein n=1 Tax=Niameybacter sp. TaxID=2033640 RepID=UPI002FC5F81A
MWKKHGLLSYSQINSQKIKIQNTVSAIFLLDQKIDSVEFIERAALVATEFNTLSDEHKLRLKDWLDHIIEDPIRKVVLDILESDMSEEEVRRMTANITKTLQEEKEQAEKKGKLEGEREKSLEVAKKMLSKGMSIADIIEITGLIEKDIEEL